MSHLFGEDFARLFLLHVPDHLGEAENAHGDHDYADAIRQFRNIERIARHPRVDIRADEAAQESQTNHRDRLDQRARGQHDRADQAQHHQGKIFGRPELEGDFGERRCEGGHQQRRHAAGKERAEGRGGQRHSGTATSAPFGSRRGRSRPMRLPRAN